MKKTKKSASLMILLILVLTTINFSIDAKSDEINNTNKNIININSDDVIFFEDFDDYPDLTHIHNIFTSFLVRDGVCELTLYRTFRYPYFNVQLGNSPQYKFNNMTVKARIINKHDVPFKKLKGSVGWGLCNQNLKSFEYEFVWFIYQQGSPFYPWNGLWVWSRNSSGEFSAKKIEGYDIFEWHVYDINWTEEGYDFYIDGEHVAQITKGVTQKEMGIEIWNDNTVWYSPKRNWSRIPIMKWGLIPVFHKVKVIKKLDIDYVKITE